MQIQDLFTLESGIDIAFQKISKMNERTPMFIPRAMSIPDSRVNRSWVYHKISGWNSQFQITGILTARTLGLFKNYVSTTKWGERAGMHIGVK